MDKFEQWFINQDFYTNMRFIHGDALFIKDRDIYRVLPVQMTWVAWQSRQAEVDDLIVANAEMKSRLNDAYTDGQGSMYAIKQKEIDRLQSQINEMTEVGLSQESALMGKDKWIENISLLVISLRNEFDLHGGGDQVERQIELLEEALRGES